MADKKDSKKVSEMSDEEAQQAYLDELLKNDNILGRNPSKSNEAEIDRILAMHVRAAPPDSLPKLVQQPAFQQPIEPVTPEQLAMDEANFIENMPDDAVQREIQKELKKNEALVTQQRFAVQKQALDKMDRDAVASGFSPSRNQGRITNIADAEKRYDARTGSLRWIDWQGKLDDEKYQCWMDTQVEFGYREAIIPARGTRSGAAIADEGTQASSPTAGSFTVISSSPPT
jgi:hypothetical protein